MAQKIKSLTPETFWELYADKLNEEGEKVETHKAYQHKSDWTDTILKVAREVIHNMLRHIADDGNCKVDSEGFRIDLIGYTTKWPEERTKEKQKRQHDWELKVAYEHENDPAEWDYELCNLCHIVADLRVISSYYDFRKKEDIRDLLQKKMRRLGMWRIHRVPNGHWLFVFGPRRVCEEERFRAFTIDSELKVIDITGDKEVRPGMWKK